MAVMGAAGSAEAKEAADDGEVSAAAPESGVPIALRLNHQAPSAAEIAVTPRSASPGTSDRPPTGTRLRVRFRPSGLRS